MGSLTHKTFLKRRSTPIIFALVCGFWGAWIAILLTSVLFILLVPTEIVELAHIRETQTAIEIKEVHIQNTQTAIANELIGFQLTQTAFAQPTATATSSPVSSPGQSNGAFADRVSTAVSGTMLAITLNPPLATP